MQTWYTYLHDDTHMGAFFYSHTYNERDEMDGQRSAHLPYERMTRAYKLAALKPQQTDRQTDGRQRCMGGSVLAQTQRVVCFLLFGMHSDLLCVPASCFMMDGCAASLPGFHS
uniref:Uncharacterized protein n=1 Tax=Vitrella brassicaformis TaxID=1169539 RepID=A0A6U4DDE5_9ALVE